MRGEKRFPRSLFAQVEGVFIKKTPSIEAGPLKSDIERAECFSHRVNCPGGIVPRGSISARGGGKS